MDSVRSRKAASAASAAPFDLLPFEIRERIFSLLPISTLAVSTAVSKTWLSVIRSSTFLSVASATRSSSPDDLYFLLFSSLSTPKVFFLYRPHYNRWVSVAIPRSTYRREQILDIGRTKQILDSDGFHLLVRRKKDSSMVVCNLFTHQVANIPPMINSLHSRSYVLGMFASESREGLWNYKIVAVPFFDDNLPSQVYDSESGNWTATWDSPSNSGFWAILSV